ncbi:hypothetical protein HanIR_Chr04g0181601 [Helianthus annuus]|nr:hypothetical protein HanIR_Chr04g0181601 [Helianthus annuus]
MDSSWHHELEGSGGEFRAEKKKRWWFEGLGKEFGVCCTSLLVVMNRWWWVVGWVVVVVALGCGRSDFNLGENVKD